MTRRFQVLYTPESQDDLRAIYNHIAFRLRERITAQRQIRRIHQAVQSLSALPARYPRVSWEPWASMGMRKMSVDNYTAYYLVEGQTVSVIRILYAGRDAENIARDNSE